MESMMTGEVSPSRFRTGSAATRSSSARLGARDVFAFRVPAPSEAAPAAVAPVINFLRLTCIRYSLPLGRRPEKRLQNPDRHELPAWFAGNSLSVPALP